MTDPDCDPRAYLVRELSGRLLVDAIDGGAKDTADLRARCDARAEKILSDDPDSGATFRAAANAAS